MIINIVLVMLPIGGFYCRRQGEIMKHTGNPERYLTDY